MGWSKFNHYVSSDPQKQGVVKNFNQNYGHKEYI